MIRVMFCDDRWGTPGMMGMLLYIDLGTWIPRSSILWKLDSGVDNRFFGSSCGRRILHLIYGTRVPVVLPEQYPPSRSRYHTNIHQIKLGTAQLTNHPGDPPCRERLRLRLLQWHKYNNPSNNSQDPLPTLTAQYRYCVPPRSSKRDLG